MWYQHDGASAHKSEQPCTFLAQTFDTRKISYGGQEVAEAIGGVSDADYMASVDCVARIIDEEPNPECKLQGMKVGTEFLNAMGISPDDMDDNQRADITCL
ncbi:hypothetical protein TNCV_3598031 [Trichonephila clavipes]|nr:hypothetical protein TNCV_3598031 [Trichonephila clavipes]